MMLKKISLFLFISLLLNASNSFAAGGPKTEEDWSLLPPFCKARSVASSPEGQLWEKRLDTHGQGFIHVHHYCGALHDLRLANSLLATDADTKMEKRGLYGAVLPNIKYMEEHADPQFVIFPNIYATGAEALFALDRPVEATAYLTKSISKNKKFTKAYKMLADYYIKTGDKKSATEILQEGLKYSPRSRALQKRLNALSK